MQPNLGSSPTGDPFQSLGNPFGKGLAEVFSSRGSLQYHNEIIPVAFSSGLNSFKWMRTS